MAQAIDAGVNYFDVAPPMATRERLGPALAPYVRMCTWPADEERSAKGARESWKLLRKLRTTLMSIADA